MGLCLIFFDLQNRFDISFKQTNPLNSIITVSPNNMVKVTGSLGHIIERGPSNTSMECQLAQQLSTKIKYNQVVDYKQVSKITTVL